MLGEVFFTLPHIKFIMNVHFITSTIKDWISLLAEKSFRNIIIESIQFLIEEKRILLHGYVIMPNHIHKIYTVNEPYQLSDILRDFHKFTSQQILKIMKKYKILCDYYPLDKNMK